MEIETAKVLGCDVSLITLKDAADFVLNEIKENRGVKIVTINPEMVELAKQNHDFNDLLKQTELVVADGSGIRLGLRLKGIKQEPVPGIDLAKLIIEKCANDGIPVALIGAKEEILQTACENLQKDFPNLSIAYKQNGYFASENESEIIENIKKSGAKFVLAALGAPKQEFFVQKCSKEMPEKSFIGVGGSFDVWAGVTERAPLIYRKFGCEWLYRTIKQPWRIKRIYKTLPMFLIKVIMESITDKIKGK